MLEDERFKTFSENLWIIQDLVFEAVKRYLKGPEADYAKLLKYAEIFNVRDDVRKDMEILTWGKSYEPICYTVTE